MTDESYRAIADIADNAETYETDDCDPPQPPFDGGDDAGEPSPVVFHPELSRFFHREVSHF